MNIKQVKDKDSIFKVINFKIDIKHNLKSLTYHNRLKRIKLFAYNYIPTEYIKTCYMLLKFNKEKCFYSFATWATSVPL